MSNLILLTNGFPYGNWEPYLETEVNYYSDFDKVYICSLQVRKEHLSNFRELPQDNIRVCPVPYAHRIVYLFHSVHVLFDGNLYSETIRLVKDNRFTFKRFIKLAIFLSRAHYEMIIILKFLNKEGLLNRYSSFDSGGGVLYSYRFEYQPYVGALLKKHLPNYKLVSRAHRFDLYEEERDVSYIPLREYLLSKIDRTILIADDGKNYLASKYPQYKEKLIVSRLGTIDHCVTTVKSPKESINIVSCSTVYAVKRVFMIVQALSYVQGISVNWTHYGEGEQLNETIKLCEDTLPDHITYDFRGYVSNEQILKEYEKKKYHLFLNVSESEGIPVSIMEALSFGIPCIATDVGGTKEIIEDGMNGILLDKHFDILTLADWIVKFTKMSDEAYQTYRKNARKSWQEKYSADRNYREFLSFLQSV